MSVASEITRLQGLRNALRTKLTALGIASGTENMESCVTLVEEIKDNGAVSKKLDVSEPSYTVPAGYHNGSGSVLVELEEKTVSANGTYTPTAGKVFSQVTVEVENAASFQEKTVTPAKTVQTVEPDEGYDALSKVTVGAIPDNYGDVSGVTASASEVLANKVFVDSTGVEKAGTMTNNGSVSASIDGLNVMSYTVPEGYHSGSGKVTLTGDIETALAAI